MEKKQLLKELKEVIKTIEMDCRKDWHGVKIMVCEHNWRYKKAANDSNLFMDAT